MNDDVMHEMRNQLAVVRANLEAFIDGKLPPTAERLQVVSQALSHLESLLEEARAEDRPNGIEPSMAVKPRRINVCVLLAAEFRALEAVAASKGVTLSVTQCAHRAKACEEFLGDPVRIGQIIKNVLLNAVRYTPSGGLIGVDCSRNADEVQVTISDSGPGISSEDARNVFESGFRGAAASGTLGEGRGLAMVRDLVERQGGKVILAGDVGQGATFIVKLPGTPEAFVT